MPTQNRMSLQTAVFNPAPFQPVAFTPQAADVSLLSNAFSTIASREEKASEKLSAMDASLAQLRSKMHQDEETLKWFDDFSNEQKLKVKNYVNNYDFAGAINKAVELGGSILNNADVQGRIYANEKYEKLVASLDDMLKKGDIEQPTYDWWKDTHEYKYKPITDGNGNIVGGDLDMSTSLPVKDINWAGQAMAAFKLISPSKKGSSTSRSTQVSNTTDKDISRGKATYKAGESVSSSYTSSSNTEKVLKQDIIDRMEELLSSTSGGYAQAEQAFDVAMHDFNKLLDAYNLELEKDPNSDAAKSLGQKIDARKKIFYKNDAIIDYKEYYARMITDSLYADGLAYDWKTTSSGSTAGYGITDTTAKGLNSGGRMVSDHYIPGYEYDTNSGMWLGPRVQMADGTADASGRVNDAAGGIDGLLK